MDSIIKLLSTIMTVSSEEGLDTEGWLTTLAAALIPVIIMYSQIYRSNTRQLIGQARRENDDADTDVNKNHLLPISKDVSLLTEAATAAATAVLGSLSGTGTSTTNLKQTDHHDHCGDAAYNRALIANAPKKKGYFGVLAKPFGSNFNVGCGKGLSQNGDQDNDENISSSIQNMDKFNCYVEASVSDLTSCINASLGGVNSIELCCNRTEGGTTPSYGLIAAAVRHFRHSDVSIHVLIRPRGGDFCYSDGEMECIIEDVCMCRELGVDGIVVGFLTAQGHIDYDKLQTVMDIVRSEPVSIPELSHPQQGQTANDSSSSYPMRHMHVTFHRAFDICRDISETGGDTAGLSDTASTMDVTFVDGRKHISHVVVRSIDSDSGRGRSYGRLHSVADRDSSGSDEEETANCSTTAVCGGVSISNAASTGSAGSSLSALALSVDAEGVSDGREYHYNTGVSDTWVDCEAESSSYRQAKAHDRRDKGGKDKGQGKVDSDAGTGTGTFMKPGSLLLSSATVESAPCSPLTLSVDRPSAEFLASPLVCSAVTTARRLADMGVTRILTSGRCKRIEQSIRASNGTYTYDNLICAMRHSVNNACTSTNNSNTNSNSKTAQAPSVLLQFVVASGICADNVSTVLQYTQAHCLHAGSSLHTPVTSVFAEQTSASDSSTIINMPIGHSAMNFKNALVSDAHFGPAGVGVADAAKAASASDVCASSGCSVALQVPYTEFQTTDIVDIDLTRDLVNKSIACWDVIEPKL